MLTLPIVFSELLGVDYAVIGEGEITDCELAMALDNNEPVDNILGLVIKKEDGYVFTGERPFIRNLDSAPLPSYEGLDIEKYLDEQAVDGWYHTYAFFSDNPRIMPMCLARSCPFMCSFCYHPIGRGYRSRSLDNFFDELDSYIKKYQINAIALVDECFSIIPERVYEFCERIKPYGISWACQMRVETYSEGLLKTMVEAGCVSACFGVENMSQTILDDMNKHVTVEQLQNALNISYYNKGASAANLLFGAEAETLDTLKVTIDWMNDNEKYNIVNTVPIGTYPGSKYYTDAVKRGLIIDKKAYIAKGCPIINMGKLSEEKHMYMRKYIDMRQRKIKNEGKVISFHETDVGYDAVLKCSHCGSEILYKGIRKATIQRGVLRTMGCRNCGNFSDYVFDRSVINDELDTMNFYYDLLFDVCDDGIGDYLRDTGINKAIIYGVLYSGFVYRKLIEENVDVICGIDRNYSQFSDWDYPVISPEAELPYADIIIVVPTGYFDDIYNSLIDRTDSRIVSVDEMIQYNRV